MGYTEKMTDSGMKSKRRHEVRDTLAIGVPLATSQLVYASSSFISTVMVAALGEEALAATVIVNLIWLTLSVFFFGILNAIAGIVAHEYGAKQREHISLIMGQAFILSVIMAVVISALLLSIPFFIHLSTQPPHVLAIAKAYNTSLIWMIPALIFLITTEQFLAGIHQTKLVLRISMLVVPLEIALIYGLMFGHFGLPRCGVSGIGYGFAISYSLTSVAVFIYLCFAPTLRHYAIFKHVLHFDWHEFKKLCRVGLPFGLVQLIEISTLTLMTFWIGHFGTTFLAAHQIAIQYITFLATLIFSMSQAVMIRVSHAMGADQRDRLYQTAFIGMGLNTLVMLVIAGLFCLVPELVLRLDFDVTAITNASLTEKASGLMAIGGLYLLIDNFRMIGMGALRGLHDTHTPLLITMLSFWLIGSPAAYILAFPLHWGGLGIWWGLILGVATGAIVVQWRLFDRLGKASR